MSLVGWSQNPFDQIKCTDLEIQDSMKCVGIMSQQPSGASILAFEDYLHSLGVPYYFLDILHLTYIITHNDR